ncbi:MAG: tail fiber domain-containing protein [Ferruginibacter sp.]
MKKSILLANLLFIISHSLFSQNVGIGTATPLSKLTVFNSGAGIEHTNGTLRVGTYVNSSYGQIGTITNHPFQLMTNNGTNQFVLLTNGNVGIANANPPEKLTVQTNTGNFGLLHTDGTVSVGSYINDNFGGSFGTKSNHPLYFFTNNGGYQLSLLQNGNFGIGTITPSERLTIQTASGSVGLLHTDGTVKIATYVGNSGGSFGTVSGDDLSFFTAGNSPQLILTTDGMVHPVYGMNVYLTTGTPSTTGVASTVVNSGNINTAINAYAEAAAHNTAINAYAAGSSTSYGIYSQGTTGAYAGYFNGNVLVTGTFSNPSDRSLKTNIQDYNNALDAIGLLKVKTYEYNEADKKSMGLPAGSHFGVIAQDLQKVFPTLVNQQYQPIYENKKVVKNSKEVTERALTGTKEYLAVNYMELIPVLIKAVQEEDEKIKALEARLAKYESKN